MSANKRTDRRKDGHELITGIRFPSFVRRRRSQISKLCGDLVVVVLEFPISISKGIFFRHKCRMGSASALAASRGLMQCRNKPRSIWFPAIIYLLLLLMLLLLLHFICQQWLMPSSSLAFLSGCPFLEIQFVPTKTFQENLARMISNAESVG